MRVFVREPFTGERLSVYGVSDDIGAKDFHAMLIESGRLLNVKDNVRLLSGTREVDCSTPEPLLRRYLNGSWDAGMVPQNQLYLLARNSHDGDHVSVKDAISLNPGPGATSVPPSLEEIVVALPPHCSIAYYTTNHIYAYKVDADASESQATTEKDKQPVVCFELLSPGLDRVKGEVTWDETRHILTFHPEGLLCPGATHIACISCTTAATPTKRQDLEWAFTVAELPPVRIVIVQQETDSQITDAHGGSCTSTLSHTATATSSLAALSRRRSSAPRLMTFERSSLALLFQLRVQIAARCDQATAGRWERVRVTKVGDTDVEELPDTRSAALLNPPRPLLSVLCLLTEGTVIRYHILPPTTQPPPHHSGLAYIPKGAYNDVHWVNGEAGYFAVCGKMTPHEEEALLLAVVSACDESSSSLSSTYTHARVDRQASRACDGVPCVSVADVRPLGMDVGVGGRYGVDGCTEACRAIEIPVATEVVRGNGVTRGGGGGHTRVGGAAGGRCMHGKSAGVNRAPEEKDESVQAMVNDGNVIRLWSDEHQPRRRVYTRDSLCPQPLSTCAIANGGPPPPAVRNSSSGTPTDELDDGAWVCGGDASDAIGSSLAEEMRVHGYVVVDMRTCGTAHNVQRVVEAASTFFELPDEVKRRHQTSSFRYLGYYDCTKYNKQIYQVRTTREPLPAAFHGPDSPFAADCTTAAYREMASVCRDVLRHLCRAIGIRDMATFQQLLDDPNDPPSCGYSMTNLSLFKYNGTQERGQCKPAPPSEMDVQSPGHTDVGLVTIIPLVAHGQPGLHIYDLSLGHWVDVETHAPSGHAVVFVGETLSFMSNGFFFPAVHEVCHLKGRPRGSVVMQYLARTGAKLDYAMLDASVVGPRTSEWPEGGCTDAGRFVHDLSASRVANTFV